MEEVTMNGLELFDLLDSTQRILVHANKERRVLITWNRNKTLQAWKCLTPTTAPDQYDEIACRVLDAPHAYLDAAIAAISWIGEGDL